MQDLAKVTRAERNYKRTERKKVFLNLDDIIEESHRILVGATKGNNTHPFRHYMSL